MKKTNRRLNDVTIIALSAFLFTACTTVAPPTDPQATASLALYYKNRAHSEHIQASAIAGVHVTECKPIDGHDGSEACDMTWNADGQNMRAKALFYQSTSGFRVSFPIPPQPSI